MTWSTLVAHVRNVEQCEEREARRQIGNAIADLKLFPRWTDKPKMPPIPGTKISWAPRPSTLIIPDDAPPRDANYWLECEIDPNDPDRIREPPPYNPGMNKSTARRLDKTRRYRKPIFECFHVYRLWPTAVSAKNKKTEESSVFRRETNTQYTERIREFLESNKRYPTWDEDQKWGREHHLSRERVRELRRQFRPDEIKKGGAPKKVLKSKPGQK
jgi:hypothetical protein